jgi:hypothetical protein
MDEEEEEENKNKKQELSPFNYGKKVFRRGGRISNYAQALVALPTSYISCMTANISLYL